MQRRRTKWVIQLCRATCVRSEATHRDKSFVRRIDCAENETTYATQIFNCILFSYLFNFLRCSSCFILPRLSSCVLFTATCDVVRQRCDEHSVVSSRRRSHMVFESSNKYRIVLTRPCISFFHEHDELISKHKYIHHSIHM